jgi:hypothetical protein
MKQNPRNDRGYALTEAKLNIVSEETKPQEKQGLSFHSSETQNCLRRNKTPRRTGAKLSWKRS